MKFFYISPLILQKLIWIPTRIALFLFGHLDVKGTENLKGIHSNVIFAANHTSELDPILLPASLPFFSHFSPIFYASRENKFYNTSGWRQHFYGGFFFKLWGAHSVYSGFGDYSKALENHMDLLAHGKNVFVFPEGQITPDGSIKEAHGGIGYLAELLGCHRRTVERGLNELRQSDSLLPPQRARKKGGGGNAV